MPEPTPQQTPADPNPATDAWYAGIKDEGARTALSKFESRDKLFETIGYKPPEADWRTMFKDEGAKKFAETSPDLDHLVGRALDMQKKLSGAIVPPGKDAKPEEISAYRKRLGVPEAPDGYKFKTPDGSDPTDADKALQSAMAKVMHDHHIPAKTAESLNAAWNEFVVSTMKAQVEEDKRFAEESETGLRKTWGADYDRNKTYADRAAAVMFGDQLDEIRRMETKSGRFILDHPVMLRALAAVGREMAEGGLVPPLSEKDLGQVNDQIADVRAKQAKALSDGNHREANRLYQKEQELIAKSKGSRPIVGAGRAA